MAQQTINLGAAPDDGTGDTLRAGGDKINDNFDELYDETLKLKGSTDCSTNPNYPAASKADSYRVSVAGKIGGASGIDVEIGDFYYALADNAGGTQAAVGSSWDVLQGNTTGTGGSVDVEDEGIAVAAATVLNFTGAGVVATDAGGGQVDVTIAGGGGGVDIEDEGVAEATGATVLNFTGAGVTATDVGAGQVDIDIPGGGAASGTSFPGSPLTDDLFYRTDRRIEYFYDGAQWLSTQLFTLTTPSTGSALSANTDYRFPPAFAGNSYDIYIETFTLTSNVTSATTGTNYFTARMATFESTGSVTTNLGAGLSTQSDAQNTWVHRSENINAVAANTLELILVSFVRVASGTAHLVAAFTFRLVG